MDAPSAMTIGTLAREAGVNVETIRYYQRLKLVPEPRRTHGSVRRYDRDTVERVRAIRRAQRLGFTLAEIATLFRLDAKRDRHQAHALSVEKIRDIEQRIADLHAMKDALARLVAACEADGGRPECPILEAFRGADENR